MNFVAMVGRLTKDPVVNYTNNGLSIARFTIACDRRFKKEGEQTADFLPCVAFGKPAEAIEKYFKKGNRIGITGRIQTGSYDNKDGQKVYTTDIIVESFEFVESKKQGEAQQQSDPAPFNADGFEPIPDSIDEQVPF